MIHLVLAPPGGHPIQEVHLDLRDQRVRHAIAMACGGLAPADLLDLQVVAVAIAWPVDVPKPWVAAEEAEVHTLRGEVEGLRAYLSMPTVSGDERGQAVRELVAVRARLAEAERRVSEAEVVLGGLADRRARDAARVLASIPAPPLAVYRAGDNLVVSACNDLLSGWDEYQEAKSLGFTLAPDGSSSAGASSRPTGGLETPSGG